MKIVSVKKICYILISSLQTLEYNIFGYSSFYPNKSQTINVLIFFSFKSQFKEILTGQVKLAEIN